MHITIMASRKTPFLKVFTKREPKFKLHESTMSFMSDDMGDLMKYSGTGVRKSDLGSLHESCSESQMDTDAFVREVPSPVLSRSSSLRDLQSHLGQARRNKELTEDDGNRSQNTAPVHGSRSTLNFSPGRSSSPSRRLRVSPGSLKIKGLFSSSKSPFASKNKKAAKSTILGELAIASLSRDEEDGPSNSQEESASNDESNHNQSDDAKSDAQATEQQPLQQKPDMSDMRLKKRRGGRRPGRKQADETETNLQNLPTADIEATVRTFNRSISTDTFAQFQLGDHVPIKEKKPKPPTTTTTTIVDANTEKTNSSSSSEDESDATSEGEDEESVTEAAASGVHSATESTDDTNITNAPDSTRGRKVRVVVRQRRRSSRSRGRSRGKSRGRTPKSSNNNMTADRRRSSKDVEDEVRELLGLKPVNGPTTRKKEAPAEKDPSDKLVLPSSKQKDDPPPKQPNTPATDQVNDLSPKRSTMQTPSQMEDSLEDSPPKRTTLPEADVSSPDRSTLLVPRNAGSLRQVIPSALNANKFGESMAVLHDGGALLDMDAGPVPTPRRSGRGVFGSLRKVLSDRSFSLSPRRMRSQRSLSEDIGLPGLDASRREEENEPLVEIMDSPQRKSKSQKTLNVGPLRGESAKENNLVEEANDAAAIEKQQDHKDKMEVEATTEEETDQVPSDHTAQRKQLKQKRRSKTPTPKPRVKDKMGRVRRRASLNNVLTSESEEIASAAGGLGSFVASSNNKVEDVNCTSPTKGRRASQSTRPRRKMSIAELEKSTTSLVAINAIRDVAGSKGKSPRRRIRKRMTVDYSATENDNKSSDTADKIRNLYSSPEALIEGDEPLDRENEAAQPLVAIVDDESDAEESDIEPAAVDETDALEQTAEKNDPLEVTKEGPDDLVGIVTDFPHEASNPSDAESLAVGEEALPPKNNSVEDEPTVSVDPPSVVESTEATVRNPASNVPSHEEIRKEYAQLQSELNLSKMRMRLASMEVSNLEREIQQLKDRLCAFQDI